MNKLYKELQRKYHQQQLEFEDYDRNGQSNHKSDKKSPYHEGGQRYIPTKIINANEVFDNEDEQDDIMIDDGDARDMIKKKKVQFRESEGSSC